MVLEVELDEQSERFVAQCIASGRYKNLDEVADAALRLLQRQDAEARKEA